MGDNESELCEVEIFRKKTRVTDEKGEEKELERTIVRFSRRLGKIGVGSSSTEGFDETSRRYEEKLISSLRRVRWQGRNTLRGHQDPGIESEIQNRITSCVEIINSPRGIREEGTVSQVSNLPVEQSYSTVTTNSPVSS